MFQVKGNMLPFGEVVGSKWNIDCDSFNGDNKYFT